MSGIALAENVYTLLYDEKPELGEHFKAEYRPRSNAPADEIRELNDYLRIELSKITLVSTLQERRALVNEVTPEIWLGYFRKIILPTLKQFGFQRG